VSAELDAALRFLARVDDAVAGELVQLGWGTGVFDRARPLVWDGNYVRAELTAELEAAYLAGSAEPLFAERGLAHRMAVVPDEREGKRLAPGFEALGWRRAHEVVMVSRIQPTAPRHQVEQVSVAGLRQARREVELAEPPGDADPARVAVSGPLARSRVGGAAREDVFGRPSGVEFCRIFVNRHLLLVYSVLVWFPWF